MKCDTARELIPLYVVGELDEDQTAMLEEHLASCEECRNDLMAQEVVQEFLDIVCKEDVMVPSSVTESWKEELEEHRNERVTGSWWRRGLVAVAAVVVMLVGAGVAWLWTSTGAHEARDTGVRVVRVAITSGMNQTITIRATLRGGVSFLGPHGRSLEVRDMSWPERVGSGTSLVPIAVVVRDQGTMVLEFSSGTEHITREVNLAAQGTGHTLPTVAVALFPTTPGR